MTKKVALITGGGSGMGQLMAKQLAEKGHRVVILDVNEPGMVETCKSNDNISYFVCDVTNREQVENIVAEVEKDVGPIWRMAHAAGIMPGGTLVDMPSEKIVQLMMINYGGTVHLTKAVMPYMLKRNAGEIIIFGSSAGIVPSSNLGAYCATKSAVNTFTEVLHYENRGNNIKILLVCPPAVDTPLIKQALDTGPKGLESAAKSGKMADAGSIISAIEKGLEKGKWKVLPGEAAAGEFLRRLSPSLLWKIVDASNK
ncbi:SDR family NAD(P)-dependent oxidoreductase [Spongiibacter sp. KMU-166]|uniref:SDR family NAD(P)-dependent oxidoreductase n=1 Tax=Spongiibacter thalassae TaxID=2721624 RepID=A0ABX1GAM9_9GAMM|nr:SDR family NAD(P)-dependent oxidoreductase [Spongiibacter thalassae]NKI16001.1 SDR family NAD(P)-dependent oxidoreductase [Spongiibacter thalassae]